MCVYYVCMCMYCFCIHLYFALSFFIPYKATVLLCAAQIKIKCYYVTVRLMKVIIDLWLCFRASDDEDKDGERVDSNDPEEMFQNIQLQKEIIANIRTKPWPIRRKLKVLK